jgi:ribosomal protein S18 acetylase RimI-like enzyme
MAPDKIELASYVSWPAFAQVDYRGLVLRFAEGCTKRSNSVNAIVQIRDNMEETVAHCESLYRQKNLPTIFRMLSFVDNAKLDSYLVDQGYAFIEPSLVLAQSLGDVSDSSENTLPVSMDRLAWLKIFEEIVGIDPNKRAVHAKIIDRVPETSLFTILEHGGKPVACGLGVLHDGYFGIFDIVTNPQDRQRGYGTKLVKQMLSWARQNGGQHAYVQVLAQNAPAVRLYEKLGYRRLYHYWYRIQKSS